MTTTLTTRFFAASRLCVVFFLTFMVCCHGIHAAEKPNIVIIFIDDMGYGDIGPFGAERNTPNLDRMAVEGMKLTDFYVSSSACTPSRAALMTGCYADRIGMGASVVFPADKRGLNPNEITVAEILKKGGYATGCFGKWHLGDQPEFMPLAQGFDEYQGIPYSNDMWVNGNPKRNYPPLPWIKQDKPVAHIPNEASQAVITDAVTDAAVDFIKRHKDVPFFCYVPHSAVHAPHMVTPARLAAAGGDVMTALVTEIDNSTGRILQTLRDLEIAENSFVLFTNDNGGAGRTSPGPLRGAKFGPKYEGHMRVATLAWWPGKIPAGSVSPEIMTTTDLLPTVAKFTGQAVPDDRIIDGKDVSEILLGKPDGWRYIRYADGTEELYDHDNDPWEHRNLASDPKQASVIARHRAVLSERQGASRRSVTDGAPGKPAASALPLTGKPKIRSAPIRPLRVEVTPAEYKPADTDILIADVEDKDYGDWQPVPGHMMTRWADDVDLDNPLPEYPRPQLVRDHWVNLNGLWDYAVTGVNDPQPTESDGKILVPFCIESALSGVKRKFTRDDRLWYSRSFNAPSLAEGERLRLNFGAVDYEATVQVNGKWVGTHKGGYDAFSFDITDSVQPGKNTLVVSVLDAQDGPKGKQNAGAFDNPRFIFYTATSGIWQTVWLETVPANHVSGLTITPDIDLGAVAVAVQADAGTANVSVKDGETIVSQAQGKAGEAIVLKVPDPKLWSPELPFLYDLEITLGDDKVSSYFGMRKISMARDEKGHLRPMLNNEPIFMAGPLDQGYWPDGIYTAPTDEALKFDLEMTKRFGFNSTRKHVKVEPARWYYWCDKLGLLVWQDMPNGSAGKDAKGFQDGVPRSKALAEQFELEMREMIREHYNHPSIIMWVLFNEAWGQYDTPRLTEMARKEDPTRLLNSGSGWFLPKDCGDVVDRHKYKGTVPVAPEEKRIGTLGEFGGFGLVTPDNQWVEGLTESSVYGTCTDQRDYENQYLNAWRKVCEHDKLDGTSAAIYTQLTDVETEVNGLMSYDRKVIKADVDLFASAVGRREFPKQPTIEILVPTSREMPQKWWYTEQQPADGWNKHGADLTGWKKGNGVFGHKYHRNGSIKIGTEWKSLNLWVVRTFDLPREPLKRPVLRIAYDDNATVYINGVEALRLKRGTNRGYQDIPLPSHAAKALKPGTNILAIHVDNQKLLNTREPDAEKRAGSQFIDAGIGDESIEW